MKNAQVLFKVRVSIWGNLGQCYILVTVSLWSRGIFKVQPPYWFLFNTNDAGHLFMCLFAIITFSSAKCPFLSSVHFLVGFFCYFTVQLHIFSSSLQLVVLVCSGCYNKTPEVGQLINNRSLFFTVLEAGSPRSECQYSRVRTLFQVTDFQLYPPRGEGTRELCGICFCFCFVFGFFWGGESVFKSTNPIHEASSLTT